MSTIDDLVHPPGTEEDYHEESEETEELLYVHCPKCGCLVVIGREGNPKCIDHLLPELYAADIPYTPRVTSYRSSL